MFIHKFACVFVFLKSIIIIALLMIDSHIDRCVKNIYIYIYRERERVRERARARERV